MTPNEHDEHSIDGGFVPYARYYPAMDHVLYLHEDCSYRADRVDAYLTILWHPYDERVVGLMLKGCRFLFQQLKVILDLKPNDFIPLVKALEVALVGGVAEAMLDRVAESRLEELYAKARELVKDVRLSAQEWLQAA